MELTRETRLGMIEAGHRRWIEREQQRLNELLAGHGRRRAAALRDEDEGQDFDGYEPLAFEADA